MGLTANSLRIASAQGIPGTAGPLVTNTEGRRFLLANHHVVFGGGGRVNDAVWALPEETDDLRGGAVCVGRAAPGVIGRVPREDPSCFVDCALIALDDDRDHPAWLRSALSAMQPGGCASPVPGMRVSKCGAATGPTSGLIVDVAYADHPCIDGQWWSAPGQLLIDSAEMKLNFSAPGDSGAAVLDERRRIVGLLWGSNANGQGIACPIDPVLECLGVTLS
jgi:hypothetical protein